MIRWMGMIVLVALCRAGAPAGLTTACAAPLFAHQVRSAWDLSVLIGP